MSLAKHRATVKEELRYHREKLDSVSRAVASNERRLAVVDRPAQCVILFREYSCPAFVLPALQERRPIHDEIFGVQLMRELVEDDVAIGLHRAVRHAVPVDHERAESGARFTAAHVFTLLP